MNIRFLLTPVLLCALAGCTPSRKQVARHDPPPNQSPPIRFSDITRAAGITFKHNNGAFGLKLMPESAGSGCAFLDYDNDGYQDIFLVNSRDWTDAEIADYKNGKWLPSELNYHKFHQQKGNNARALTKWVPPRPKRQHSTGALYRNNGDGTFRDVTQGSGLDIEMFGMGAAVGDYDNDGRADLYVTGYGRNYLFHNQGHGKFKEVATAAGVKDKGWSTSAAWVDYDKDGKLDLFVCHYLQWSPGTDVFFSEDGKVKSYNGPAVHVGQDSHLYRNVGGGRFVDVSGIAGIQRERSGQGQGKSLGGKSLGILILDFNSDSWPDLLVANDRARNHLFINNRNGTFREAAIEAGIAYSQTGKARAGMGIDGGDIDHSGRESVLIGNFSEEMLGLYENQGGSYIDIAQRPEVNVGWPSRLFLTFGCLFADFDNDGWLDIFAANGHVRDDLHVFDPDMLQGITQAQRPLLFRNRGRGIRPQFEEIGLHSGQALHQKVVARGLARADIDLDGDADLLVTVNGGPPLLLRNDTGEAPPSQGNPHINESNEDTRRNRALRLVLQGRRSNRSAIGAVVEARVRGETLFQWVRSGSSYLSQSELPLTLGLGQAQQVEALVIRWPSGQVTQLQNVAADHILFIDEAKGILRRQPLPLPPRR